MHDFPTLCHHVCASGIYGDTAVTHWAGRPRSKYLDRLLHMKGNILVRLQYHLRTPVLLQLSGATGDGLISCPDESCQRLWQLHTPAARHLRSV